MRPLLPLGAVLVIALTVFVFLLAAWGLAHLIDWLAAR